MLTLKVVPVRRVIVTMTIVRLYLRAHQWAIRTVLAFSLGQILWVMKLGFMRPYPASVSTRYSHCCIDPNIVNYYRGLTRTPVTCCCHHPQCMFCASSRLNRIRLQVEYYFGDANFGKDAYLQGLMGADRFIPLDVILRFPRMASQAATREDVFKVSCGVIFSNF